MVTLTEAKEYLRVDGDDEDTLIASMIATAQSLTEDILRQELPKDKELPEPIKQAILILVGTLYEERQVSKSNKSGLDIHSTLDLVRRMLFAYRKEKF